MKWMFENKMFNNILQKNKNYYKNVWIAVWFITKNIINKFFEDEFIKNIKFSKNLCCMYNKNKIFFENIKKLSINKTNVWKNFLITHKFFWWFIY